MFRSQVWSNLVQACSHLLPFSPHEVIKPQRSSRCLWTTRRSLALCICARTVLTSEKRKVALCLRPVCMGGYMCFHLHNLLFAVTTLLKHVNPGTYIKKSPTCLRMWPLSRIKRIIHPLRILFTQMYLIHWAKMFPNDFLKHLFFLMWADEKILTGFEQKGVKWWLKQSWRRTHVWAATRHE